MTATLLTRADVACVRAPNPGPLTLDGTNSWVFGRRPCWIVDPGPEIDEHLDALAAEVLARGGAGGVALTHGHADHAAGVRGLLSRLPSGVPVAAADSRVVEGAGEIRQLRDGDSVGRAGVIALPGHSPDHVGFVLATPIGAVCFTGDAVLGAGSVFVSDDMAGYLAALERLRRLTPVLICPGHGPPVDDPVAHLDAYRAHRLERERQVAAAWQRGIRDERELLEEIWGPLGERLAAVAALTLRAHLDKLRAEGRLSA